MSAVDPVGPPSSWIADHLDLLPRGGFVLEAACGRGRHALWLARMGFRVHAVDRDAEAIAFVRQAATHAGLDVVGEVRDLETDPPPDVGTAAYDAIVVVNYLHRPLFPSLIRALKPGARLVYETFTIAQATRGKPTNPAFLLQPGELTELVAPLTVLRSREGDFGGRFVASIVAERPPSRVSLTSRGITSAS